MLSWRLMLPPLPSSMHLICGVQDDGMRRKAALDKARADKAAKEMAALTISAARPASAKS